MQQNTGLQEHQIAALTPSSTHSLPALRLLPPSRLSTPPARLPPSSPRLPPSTHASSADSQTHTRARTRSTRKGQSRVAVLKPSCPLPARLFSPCRRASSAHTKTHTLEELEVLERVKVPRRRRRRTRAPCRTMTPHVAAEDARADHVREKTPDMRPRIRSQTSASERYSISERDHDDAE